MIVLHKRPGSLTVDGCFGQRTRRPRARPLTTARVTLPTISDFTSHADRPVLAIASPAVTARSGQAVEHARLIGRPA